MRRKSFYNGLLAQIWRRGRIYGLQVVQSENPKLLSKVYTNEDGNLSVYDQVAYQFWWVDQTPPNGGRGRPGDSGTKWCHVKVYYWFPINSPQWPKLYFYPFASKTPKILVGVSAPKWRRRGVKSGGCATPWRCAIIGILCLPEPLDPTLSLSAYE